MKKLVAVVVAMTMVTMFAAPAMAQGPAPYTSLVDVALEVNAESGEFSILIAALLAADPVVLSTLDARGQRTVFAPTDAAFLDLLDELGISAEELLSDSDLVTAVLLYHVVPGRRLAESVVTSSRLRTLSGGFLLQSGGVLTDANGREATIVLTDVEATNGVIHVIDRVVLP